MVLGSGFRAKGREQEVGHLVQGWGFRIGG